MAAILNEPNRERQLVAVLKKTIIISIIYINFWIRLALGRNRKNHPRRRREAHARFDEKGAGTLGFLVTYAFL